MSIIETRSLTKCYSKTNGIHNVNLRVEKGEIFGFLGPNGAGKTTTIRLLLDLINPTSGQILIFGKPVDRRNVKLRNNIGYLPGELRLYERLAGRTMLCYLGRFQQDNSTMRQQELLNTLSLLPSDLKRPMRFYSQGMKRKIGIVQAMQHNPRLLILDEPTEGLDPLMQQNFYQLLYDYRNQGGTVFMSSHILSEVEAVCDRVGIIRNGEIVAIEDVDQLRKQLVRRLRLVTTKSLNVTHLFGPGITIHKQDGAETILFIDGSVNLKMLLTKLAQLDIVDLSFEHAKLEDFFLQYYNGKISHD